MGMRILIIGSLIFASLAAQAAEFPDREMREAEVKLGILKIGELLGKIAGKGTRFDSSLALQNCDSVDKSLEDSFQARREARLKAKRDSEVNVRGWEERAKSAILKEDYSMISLKDALRLDARKWRREALEHLPCTDSTAVDFVENLADDYNAADEPVYNLCVRTVKALRKSPDCGNSFLPPQTSPTSLSIPTP